jgi:diguanylate cyclase (GGDEF)-like protein/putative nucleotidyltransferase with HDIG domain
LLAALVLAVFASGGWGGLSLVHAAKEARRAGELRSAYDGLRFATAMELSALRFSSAHADRSSSDFFAGARQARGALQRLQANAEAADGPRVRRISTLDAHVVEQGGRYFSALGARERTRARSLRTQLERGLRAEEGQAVRGSADFRLRQAGRWPVGAIDWVALVGLCLVFSGGLALTILMLVRLVGWRRRQLDAHRLELARLEREALTDSLTGLRNHRAFQEDLTREIERRNRTGAGFALLMVDMDGLKQVNDAYGHQAGDERIKAVADSLRETVRGSDAAYRVGGDEFMVLLPRERAWGALTYAHRLHSAAARTNVPVTVGIAESVATEGRDSLIKHADLALYEAKRAHRKTVVFNPGLEPHRPEADEDQSRHHQKLLATALARAVDAKDAGTRNHCETVAEISAIVGRELGLDSERVQRLRLAGLLHDVGKIGIADAILQKPSKLAREERAIMSTHTTIGHNIVSAADLEDEADWVLHHHERWDGEGYPDGLRGGQIPLESRIILVADAFEAITADRPYRPGRSAEEALDELVRHAGSQFDPACVAALCAVFGHEAGLVVVGDELGERRRSRRESRTPRDPVEQVEAGT